MLINSPGYFIFIIMRDECILKFPDNEETRSIEADCSAFIMYYVSVYLNRSGIKVYFFIINNTDIKCSLTFFAET